MIGLTLYTSAVSSGVAKTGMIPDPKPNEQILGGHAVCLVGYNDATKLFKFKNSWGPNWGDNGYGYVSYQYVEKYGSDAWAIVS